jgi:alkane 1-monooxygenase
MSSIQALARRVWVFLPYTLPLWLLTVVPALRLDQPFRIAMYISAAFAVPIVMDLIGGGVSAAALEPPPARPRVEYTILLRVLCAKLVLFQGLMLFYVVRKQVIGGELIVLGVIVGLYYGTLAIILAHELMHRASRLDQWLADVLLTTVTYPQFSIEHVYGHHITVATPADPATARLGEPLYAFVPRSVIGGLVHAWKLETERLRKRGRGVWSPGNRMLRYAVMVAAWYGAAFAWCGVRGLIVVGVQSAVAIFSLETINYMQHYGLQRREIIPGRYERTADHHSWNWETRFSGLYFLNLGRHSEHHRVASRRYEELRPQAGQPTLPGGLMPMFVTAMVPPLWFAVMNPRVEAWRRAHLGETDAAAAAPPAHAGRRAQLQALFDRWGGWFILALLIVLPIVNDAYGFQGGIAFVIVFGILMLGVRALYVRLPSSA